MKKIILSVLCIGSMLIAQDLSNAKIISSVECEAINLQVNFNSDSSQINEGSYGKIKDFAEYLKANSDKSAEIAGYTDNRSTDEYNLELSNKRAKAVYDQLIVDGVDKNRLKYKGYGEKDPIADNNTSVGKKANRRIEATLF